jgi:16S rRNA processing protein RimM
VPEGGAPALPVKPKRQPVGPQKLGPLVGTAGPDPDAPVHKVRLAVGVIVGAHGVDGEMKLRLSTDTPEHLLTIKHVYAGDAPKPLALKGVRFHQGMALIKLHGVWNREAAQDLAGTTIRIAGKDAAPLQPGEFYLYQMVGLEVFTEAGEKMGDVIDIMETGANDVFVVKPPGGGKDFLLPNTPEIVPIIDPANRRMVARPMVFYGE